MGFKTNHIVKLLQLKWIGRKTALKISDLAKDEVINDDEYIIVRDVLKSLLIEVFNTDSNTFY